MRIYLDLCALKRPFDDQSQARIRNEAVAVETIIDGVRSGLDELVWSAVLDLENDADPDEEVRTLTAASAKLALRNATINSWVAMRIEQFCKAGLREYDAAHLAYAESADAESLITCDDQFLRRARRIRTSVKVESPLEYVVRTQQ